MIESTKLHSALRQMGNKYVKKQYRQDWTPERPTTGYCYVVAEVVYHYMAPKGSHPYRMRTGPNMTHWFIKDPWGNIIDLTADQFDESLDYSKAIAMPFRTQQPSKRAQILADLLGLLNPNKT